LCAGRTKAGDAFVGSMAWSGVRRDRHSVSPASRAWAHDLSNNEAGLAVTGARRCQQPLWGCAFRAAAGRPC